MPERKLPMSSNCPRTISATTNYFSSKVTGSAVCSPSPTTNSYWPGSISSTMVSHCSSVPRSEEHTSELQSRFDLVCRLLLEKKKNKTINKVRDNLIIT